MKIEAIMIASVLQAKCLNRAQMKMGLRNALVKEIAVLAGV